MNNQNINEENDLLSYGNIKKQISNFKSAGAKSLPDFNLFDTPGHKFFKIFFHFYNGNSLSKYDSTGMQSTGLLAPTWNAFIKKQPQEQTEDQNPDEEIDESTNESDYDVRQLCEFNSAWSYLMLNGEYERADKLKSFINLLSNISSESPWYFIGVSGINNALLRPIEKNLTIPEETKKITIKCMQDSYDDRIGTLLDLYRDIVFSWVWKRWVLPENLRKFDMSIYIFESPLNPIHTYIKQNENPDENSDENLTINATLNRNAKNSYLTSYKYLEFHNCEFDYNSTAEAFSELNNVDGNSPTYSINISFEDVYETRYNEFMTKEIGDMVLWDLMTVDNTKISDMLTQPTAGKKNNDLLSQLEERITSYKNKNSDENSDDETENSLLYLGNIHGIDTRSGGSSFLSMAAGQLINAGADWLSSKISKVVLGNLHKFSLTRFSDQLRSFAQGNIMATKDAIENYKRRNKKNHNDKIKLPKPLPESRTHINAGVTNLGNLHKANTKINNI